MTSVIKRPKDEILWTLNNKSDENFIVGAKGDYIELSFPAIDSFENKVLLVNSSYKGDNDKVDRKSMIKMLASGAISTAAAISTTASVLGAWTPHYSIEVSMIEPVNLVNMGVVHPRELRFYDIPLKIPTPISYADNIPQAPKFRLSWTEKHYLCNVAIAETSEVDLRKLDQLGLNKLVLAGGEGSSGSFGDGVKINEGETIELFFKDAPIELAEDEKVSYILQTRGTFAPVKSHSLN